LTTVALLVAPAGTVLLDSVSPDTVAASLTAAAVAAAPGWGTAAVARPVPGAPVPPARPPPNLQSDPQAPVWLKTGVKTFPWAPQFPIVVTEYL
jgi:hypothetical protein